MDGRAKVDQPPINRPFINLNETGMPKAETAQFNSVFEFLCVLLL